MGKSAVIVTAILFHCAQKFTFIAFFALLVFLIVPRYSSAAEATALLGGGNALVHATTGVQHANPRSSIMEHLLFASTRGGKPDVVPPSASSTGATADDQQGDDGDPSGSAANSNGAGENGGVSGGSGGNGGSAAEGGLVRAGSVVSNANAVNVLNTVIVRISAR